MSNTLHCGACMKPMETVEMLDEHLTSCPAAKAILFPVTLLMFGARDPGHDASHLVYASNKYNHLIVEYASAIANEMNSFERSKIHRRLCDRLGLEYSDFRPFESSDILEVPTQAEAEKIIWDAIGKILRKTLDDNAPRPVEGAQQ